METSTNRLFQLIIILIVAGGMLAAVALYWGTQVDQLAAELTETQLTLQAASDREQQLAATAVYQQAAMQHAATTRRHSALATSLTMIGEQLTDEDAQLSTLLGVQALRFAGDGPIDLNLLQWQPQHLTEPHLSIYHTGQITDVLWKADDSQLLTVVEHGSAYVWDAATGDRLFTLTHGTSDALVPIKRAAWDATQQYILTLDRTGSIRIWNSATGNRHYRPFEANITLAQWHPSLPLLLTSGAKGVNIWDAAQAEVKHTLQRQRARTVEWDTSGEKVVAEIGDTTYVWDTATGEALLAAQGAFAAWNRRETQIGTTMDEQTFLWKLQQDTPPRQFDGRLLVWDDQRKQLVTHDQNRLLLWDLRSAELIVEVPQKQIEYSSWNQETGKLVTWQFHDAQPYVFDTQFPESSSVTLAHSYAVWQADWLNEGQTLLTSNGTHAPMVARKGSKASIWSVSWYGLLMRTFPKQGLSRQLWWNTEALQVATQSHEDMVQIWDISTGDLFMTFEHKWGADNLQWSHANDRIVMTIYNTVYVWNLDHPPFWNPQRDHTDELREIIWNVPYDLILLGEGAVRAHAINLYDAEFGRFQTTLDHGYMRKEHLSPSGRWLLIGNQIWDLATRQPATILQAKEAHVPVWLSDSTSLLTHDRDAVYTQWDAMSGARLNTFPHGSSVRAAQLSPDEAQFMTQSNDEVRVWSLQSGTLLYAIRSDERIDHAAWNANGTQLLVVRNKHDAIVYNADDGALVQRLRWRAGTGGRIEWHPDGKTLIQSWRGNALGEAGLRFVDVQSGELLKVVTNNPQLKQLDWSHDQQLFATTWYPDYTHEEHHQIQISDAQTGERVATLPHSAETIFLGWNADDSLGATYSNGQVHIWEMATAQLRFRLGDQAQRKLSIAWHPTDPSQLLLKEDRGRAYHYELDIPTLIATACGRISRNLYSEEWTRFLPTEPYQATCPALRAYPTGP